MAGRHYQPPSDMERQGAPPSYDSLFGKAKDIRANSSNTVDFVKNFTCFCMGTIGFSVCMAITLAIPVSMIVIGALYLDDCPAERYIPIYLVVGGSFGAVRNILGIVFQCRQKKREAEKEINQRSVNPLQSLIDCFLFAWFIAGNVWVYKLHEDFSEDPGDPKFCDPTVYWFAFWVITTVYIIMGASLVLCGFCCVCGLCLGKNN